MLTFISNLIPKNWLLASVLVLSIIGVGGYFFYEMRLARADAAVKAAELSRVQDKLDLANKTVKDQADQMALQAALMIKAQKQIANIRQKAVEELEELSNTDFGKEANSNAKELEKKINERMKQRLQAIDDASRGPK